MMFDDYNSDNYASMTDGLDRRAFMQGLLDSFGVKSLITIDAKAQHLTAFARNTPANDRLMVFTKTSMQSSQMLKFRLATEILPTSHALIYPSKFMVKDLLAGTSQMLTADQLTSEGFAVNLASEGSTAFVIEPVPAMK
jgi:hypothetical protein